MFLDEEFYQILKKHKPILISEDSKVSTNALHLCGKEVIDLIHKKTLSAKSDEELIAACKRVDTSFQIAVEKMKLDGFNYFSLDFVRRFFEKYHKDIAKILYQ